MDIHLPEKSRSDTYRCRAEEVSRMAASFKNTENRKFWEEIADE